MKLFVLVPKGGLPLPGLRPNNLSTFYPGEGALRDWRVHVRGPALFLVSPVGWAPGKPLTGTARTVYEIPRSMCFIGWQLEPGDELDALVKYSPPIPEVADDVPVGIEVQAEAPVPETPNQVDGPARPELDPPAVLPVDIDAEEFDGEDLPRQAPKKGRRG